MTEKTNAELVAKSPPPNWWKTNQTIEIDNGHDWIMDWRDQYQYCRRCGYIRRADRKSNPCKGPAKVVLR